MPSNYGNGLYGVELYSQSSVWSLAGNLTPSVVFGGNLAPIKALAGNLAPVVTFGPATLATSVDLAGNMAVQTALGASLTGVWLFGGNMPPSVGFAAELTSGPLWAASPPCTPPGWEQSTPCPPPMWTPTIPPSWELPGSPGGYGLANYGAGPYNYEAVSDASPWVPSGLCNG